jgi:hypothetical protein
VLTPPTSAAGRPLPDRNAACRRRPWPCATVRRRGAPLRLPASHRRTPGSRSASLGPAPPLPPPVDPAAGEEPPRRPAPASAPPQTAARPRPRPLRPMRAPAPPPCPGRGRANPRRHRAAVGSGSRRRRPAGRRAGPEPWRAARAKQGRGEAAGPAPTAMWGPAVSPPFYLFQFVFLFYFRLKVHKCVIIHSEM